MNNGEQIIHNGYMITCGQRGFTVTDPHGRSVKAAHNFYPYLEDAKKAIDTGFVELPIITLNGSSAASLLRDNQAARAAVAEAFEKLHACMPHPRDYPDMGFGAQTVLSHYKVAREQHEMRLKTLRQMLDELDAIAMHLVEFVK